MNTVAIEQELMLNTTPQKIYDIWMDSKKHEELTGGKADISQKTGSNFTIFDGWVTGKNVSLVPGEKIVQTWKPDEEGWPADHYSKITVELIDNKDGTTTIKFKHEDLPENIHENFEKGWHEYYWGPLKEMFR